jgi:hypothetical protein
MLPFKKAKCRTKFEFDYIWLEPILKINYPHGVCNMASRKPSGEFPNQGLGSPYKTNNKHYFYYQCPSILVIEIFQS